MGSGVGEVVGSSGDKLCKPGVPEARAILVVDDEETVGLGISETLKHSGFKSFFVTSGVAALEEVRKKNYGLVFMDIVMPAMNGLDTYRQIRNINPNIKVVLFTGFFKAVDKVIMEGVKEGMIDEFIRKPFYANEIIDIARKYLK